MDGSLDDLRARLVDAGLAHHADALLALARPSIRLVSCPVPDESAIGIGATKLGGRPDVPAGFDWPRHRGVPLSFVAQIDLAGVAVFDRERLLPDSGLLSFFVAGDQEIWTTDPTIRTGWRVIFVEPGSEVIRRNFPDDLPPYLRRWFRSRMNSAMLESRHRSQFDAVALKPMLAYSLPPHESYDGENVGLRRRQTFEEEDEVWLYSDARPDLNLAHRLLGYPRQAQGDIQLHCQVQTLGIRWSIEGGRPNPEVENVRPAAREWRLLLQLESDSHAGMSWCRDDTLYYMIRESDLRSRRWDQTWVVIECG